MLIQEGAGRSIRIDLLLAAILSFVAGGVNGAGYFAFGYFSANMTGNVSLISDHISLGQLVVALVLLSIVGLFILGAFVATLFIRIGRDNHLGNIYALTLLAEAALLLLVGVVDLSHPPVHKGVLIVGLLSFAMGIQNAASTRISESRVRTTHVSGIATDIGVGLATLWRCPDDTMRTATQQRLLLHVTTILAFLAGGIAAIVLYKSLAGGVFIAAALLIFLLGIRYLRRFPDSR
ncbi:DUF1275 domain-containing protein [Shinella daejeonensis]|uniref:YoaK family protein n=1 Tax=Shinella daejeonensis TaxID=659017 RepID=UPI0020C76700|nr:YoaK family protein [Shinella daejeonensis]MCP8896166.1 DUF1275 domain-containing protein [Shinella daejeonensis]